MPYDVARAPWLGAVLTALYTLHSSSQGAFFTPMMEVVSGGVVMLIIGVGIGIPMSFLRAREQRLIATLEARAAESGARNAELTEANEALEAFGYVVSHDLKEPVRAIENHLDAARESYAGPPEGRQLIEEAYRSNRRSYRLLGGLLAYSRASTSPATPQGMVRLVVEDNGPGFPPEVLARVPRFKSSRPSTVKGGFGLVIAHRAAHRSGGTLHVENLPDGKGARVEVELPAPPSRS